MVKANCSYCGNKVEEEGGGILFSPPDKYNRVIKFHICKKCFYKIKPKKE